MVLGAAVGSAALIGALVVGDSVKGSLRERALERLGGVEAILNSGDRLFRASLIERLLERGFRRNESGASEGKAHWPENNAWAVNQSLLQLSATASRGDGKAYANHVQLIGVCDAQLKVFRDGEDVPGWANWIPSFGGPLPI
ncbi:MAG: hypothetical protein ABL967_20415, partial [Bryobacteraceae bacterium]